MFDRLKRLPLVLALAVITGSGCSSYPRDFRAAVAAQADPASAPLGPWKGEWRSEVNGHHGPLWCIISRVDENHHAFRYRAGWGVMSFGDYTHVARTTSEGPASLRFSGEMELPGGVGSYRVEGRVAPESFEARYRSNAGDHGVMRLSRPE